MRCVENEHSVARLTWQETLAAFLEDNGVTDSEGNKDEPTLERFNAEISRYKAVQVAIQELPAAKTIGWLKIDAKPIKHALATWVTKWIFLFTQHLSNRVVTSIDDLYAFMGKADATLDKKVKRDEPPPPEEGAEPEPEPAEDAEAEEPLDTVRAQPTPHALRLRFEAKSLLLRAPATTLHNNRC